MEQRGLVVRDDCADDGRGQTVVLTDAGWATIQEAAVHHVASVREHFVDLLDPADLAAFATIAEKVARPPGTGDPARPGPRPRAPRA